MVGRAVGRADAKLSCRIELGSFPREGGFSESRAGGEGARLLVVGWYKIVSVSPRREPPRDCRRLDPIRQRVEPTFKFAPRSFHDIQQLRSAEVRHSDWIGKK